MSSSDDIHGDAQTAAQEPEEIGKRSYFDLLLHILPQRKIATVSQPSPQKQAQSPGSYQGYQGFVGTGCTPAIAG
ncbi:hypothetical protein [Sodaliphilus pleomorphus]|uniref:Uncharacterized protein n=1 Tax=Sodaliphilus pleomorphus TaxID=2606626 RepID=A0A6L5XEH5_9BACT|nr:hypothetical protein [Sodaliphilus pleomorphus]MSS17686.1 hypothetical protein [Sodaliphilus pleomorphus]